MHPNGSPSGNGHGSATWYRPWTHLRFDRRSPGYCRVTFDHPPTNAITATTVDELAELIDLIEHDSDLNVVVFTSCNPDFYLADHNSDHTVHAWPGLLGRLSRAPVVSIASIRGRARGAGAEFALACDLRFASRENARLGRFEAGVGVVPFGPPTSRLSRLVGRGRALELLLIGGDLDAPRAEQYGCVDRAVADDELDVVVEEIASRFARIDHDAITRTKSYVDRITWQAPPA